MRMAAISSSNDVPSKPRSQKSCIACVNASARSKACGRPRPRLASTPIFVVIAPKILEVTPFAHTSAEHGSDRSKFKGRCGGVHRQMGLGDRRPLQARTFLADMLEVDDPGRSDRTPDRS